MDLEEILHKLDEAKELEDWEMVDECIDALREITDNPFDEYKDEDWGWTVSTDVIQQQSAAEIE